MAVLQDVTLVATTAETLNDKEIASMNTLDRHLEGIQRFDDGLTDTPYAVPQQLAELVIKTLEQLGMQNADDVVLQWRAHCFYAAANF